MSTYLGSALGACVLLATALPAAPQAHPAFEPPSPQTWQFGPNRLVKAEVKASPHWSNCVPEHAVDGRHDSPAPHWAAEHIPVWLTVELKEPAELNLIRLWTFWDYQRYYQYVVEGSLDGQTWTVLGDARRNTTPATDAGVTFTFPTMRLKYVRTTFTHNSVGNGTGGHIVEIEGYHLPAAEAAAFIAAQRRWAAVPAGLQAAVVSLDERLPRDEPPSAGQPSWSGWGWRGQRVALQVALWGRTAAQQVRLQPTELKRAGGGVIPAAALHARFERYVLADGKLVADVLDPLPRLDLPAQTTRPVWLSVDIPADAAPGVYGGALQVRAGGGVSVSLPLALEVLPPVLPPAAQWQFRLDLWQNPYAVARYHRVEPWSPEHLRLLEPHLKLLAEAGQKCLTCSIVHHPWGTQTYDPYDSMITWLRRPDGTWQYDYTIFDTWVELGRRCGITDSINCYTVSAPTWTDEASGEVRHGGLDLKDAWRPFLRDFTAHLQAKGWLRHTALAMDEWPLERMQPMLDFLRQTAPELKIALAGSNEPVLSRSIDDWCVFISPPLDPAVAKERLTRGRPTTYYVCCGPAKPNTFTFSPPAEAAWLGWYAAAQGYSGLLRWAYDSWTADPLYDTSYVTWPAGDCFLVYPGARSSVRYERLREGIQAYEMVRLTRARLAGRTDEAGRGALQKLDEALAQFSYQRVQQEPAAAPVSAAWAALEAASRL